jgi:hypothetical protein
VAPNGQWQCHRTPCPGWLPWAALSGRARVGLKALPTVPRSDSRSPASTHAPPSRPHHHFDRTVSVPASHCPMPRPPHHHSNHVGPKSPSPPNRYAALLGCPMPTTRLASCDRPPPRSYAARQPCSPPSTRAVAGALRPCRSSRVAGERHRRRSHCLCQSDPRPWVRCASAGHAAETSSRRGRSAWR